MAIFKSSNDRIDYSNSNALRKAAALQDATAAQNIGSINEALAERQAEVVQQNQFTQRLFNQQNQFNQQQGLREEERLDKNSQFKASQQWTEGATQRAIDEESRLKKLDLERQKTEEGIVAGLAYSGAHRADDPNVIKLLEKYPEYSNLSDFEGDGAINDVSTKIGFINKVIKDNSGAGVDPTFFADQLRRTLVQSGQFTSAQVDASVAKQLGRMFPTQSEAMILKLIDATEKNAPNTSNYFTNYGNGKGSTQGNVSSLYKGGNLLDISNVAKSVIDAVGITATTPSHVAGIRLDINDNNTTLSDVNSAVANLSKLGVLSATAMQQALVFAMAPDGTLKDDYNYIAEGGSGLKNLTTLAKSIEAKENLLINSKTGNLSYPNAGNPQQSQLAAAAAAEQNKIMRGLEIDAIRQLGAPRRQTDEQLVTQYMSGLAPSGAGTTEVVTGTDTPKVVSTKTGTTGTTDTTGTKDVVTLNKLLSESSESGERSEVNTDVASVVAPNKIFTGKDKEVSTDNSVNSPTVVTAFDSLTAKQQGELDRYDEDYENLSNKFNSEKPPEGVELSDVLFTDEVKNTSELNRILNRKADKQAEFIKANKEDSRELGEYQKNLTQIFNSLDPNKDLKGRPEWAVNTLKHRTKSEMIKRGNAGLEQGTLSIPNIENLKGADRTNAIVTTIFNLEKERSANNWKEPSIFTGRPINTPIFRKDSRKGSQPNTIAESLVNSRVTAEDSVEPLVTSGVNPVNPNEYAVNPSESVVNSTEPLVTGVNPNISVVSKQVEEFNKVDPKYNAELDKLFVTTTLNEVIVGNGVYSKNMSSFMKEQLLERGKLAVELGEISGVGSPESTNYNERVIKAMYKLEKSRVKGKRSALINSTIRRQKETNRIIGK